MRQYFWRSNNNFKDAGFSKNGRQPEAHKFLSLMQSIKYNIITTRL